MNTLRSEQAALADTSGTGSNVTDAEHAAYVAKLEREAAAGRALANGLRAMGKHFFVAKLLRAYDKAVSE